MYEASSSAKRRLREIYLIGQYPCKIRVYTTLRNLKEIEKGICFISISSCSLFTTWLQYMFWLIVSLWLICLKPSYDFLLRKNIIRHILMFSFLFYDFLFLRILISTSSCSLFATCLECMFWLILSLCGWSVNRLTTSVSVIRTWSYVFFWFLFYTLNSILPLIWLLSFNLRVRMNQNTNNESFGLLANISQWL